jgi:NAD-reducing hydrogenase small subunit
MKKVKVATVWLDGCSGCHMSLLDMDAGIIALARKIDLVYGPLVDAQEFPEDVDVTLKRTHILISLGDCAVTGNVPAMRNSIPVQKLLQRIYIDGAEEGNVVPSERVPGVAQASAATARIRQSGFELAGLSSSVEGNLQRDQRSAGRQEARRRSQGEIPIRSVS